MSRVTEAPIRPAGNDAAAESDRFGIPDLLTAREVAARLRVSIGCIYALVDRGLLPCLRIGVGRGTLRFTEDDVAAYLTQARKGRPNPALKHIRSSS